nr:autotransporter domain-containing protein [Neorhizobium sp. P12A]
MHRQEASDEDRQRSSTDCGASPDRPAVWGQAFGSWGLTDSDGNAAKMKGSTGGFIAGADAAVFDTWRFGVLAGYGDSSIRVDDRNSSATSDEYDLGFYGGTQWGRLGLRTGATYTWQNIDTHRSVNFSGFGDSLSGDSCRCDPGI